MRIVTAMMKHETNTFSPIITDWARFRVDWGGRIENIGEIGEWNLQQEGLHMALTVYYP